MRIGSPLVCALCCALFAAAGSQALAQNIIVDNRPGANSIVGAEIVAKWATVIKQANVRIEN